MGLTPAMFLLTSTSKDDIVSVVFNSAGGFLWGPFPLTLTQVSVLKVSEPELIN